MIYYGIRQARGPLSGYWLYLYYNDVPALNQQKSALLINNHQIIFYHCIFITVSTITRFRILILQKLVEYAITEIEYVYQVLDLNHFLNNLWNFYYNYEIE